MRTERMLLRSNTRICRSLYSNLRSLSAAAPVRPSILPRDTPTRLSSARCRLRLNHYSFTTTANMSENTENAVATPAACIADFCLIPIGTPTPSVSKHIAEVQRVIEKSGLKYSMHSAGTSVEGPWDKVMATIGHAHAVLHSQGVARIQSDIRVGSRTDKVQHIEDKVAAVNMLLEKE